MTIQSRDLITHNNIQYHLLSSVPNKLFSPTDYNLKISKCYDTSLHKGYLCEYLISNEKLYLKNLHINHQYSEIRISLKKQPPILNNIIAVKNKSDYCFWLYEGLNLFLNFSGSIKIGLNPSIKYDSVLNFMKHLEYEFEHTIIANQGIIKWQ